MTGLLIFFGYIGIAVWSVRIIGHWTRVHNERVWHSSDIDGFDVFYVVFLAAIWPVGVPIARCVLGPPVRSRRLAVFFFGEATAEDKSRPRLK